MSKESGVANVQRFRFASSIAVLIGGNGRGFRSKSPTLQASEPEPKETDNARSIFAFNRVKLKTRDESKCARPHRGQQKICAGNGMDNVDDSGYSYEQYMCAKLARYLEDLHLLYADVKKLKSEPMLDVPLLLERARIYTSTPMARLSLRQIKRKHEDSGLMIQTTKQIIKPEVETKKTKCNVVAVKRIGAKKALPRLNVGEVAGRPKRQRGCLTPPPVLRIEEKTTTADSLRQIEPARVGSPRISGPAFFPPQSDVLLKRAESRAGPRAQKVFSSQRKKRFFRNSIV